MERDYEKVMIRVVLTGGFHGKEANPNLPELQASCIDEKYLTVSKRD
jgi:hypothetical protein